MQQHTEGGSAPGQAEIRTRRWNVSLVWIVPIVALLVGASLVVRSWMEQGPTITISFKTGEGLAAHKTLVKYRNVVIGEVTAVELAADKKSVNTTVELFREAESFASEDSVFWVVRPRIGAGGVTGTDTLLSGNFIGADAGQSTKRSKHFTGLESPPAITYGEKGKIFTLHAKDLGSLDIGSPIYYRKIPVGEVVSYALDAKGTGVDIGIFIEAPNDTFVTTNTRFWNASGIDVALDSKGVKVNTESLSSILIGGLAFRTPEYIVDDKPAAEKTDFELFADEETALAPPDGIARQLRLRFDQALRGLAVDAPVEFMGVNFGKVTAVRLDFDPVKRTFPVIVDAIIYPQRIGPAHNKMLEVLKHSPDDEKASGLLLAGFIEHGLRAQARSGNLLTGQLYISLDFYPDAEKAAFDPNQTPFMIPTVPGSLEKVQEQLQQMVNRINALPLERIANNLDGNLSELNRSLKQFNTRTLPGVQGTLDEIRKTVQAANSALAEDSPQREQMTDTLEQLERMSRSLRDLSDYLGRHPESLIRGRPAATDAQNLQP
ncbi:MCE family protein [Pseudomonas sp. BN415]|uniref:PqiB family protein n=1 Tax=Pseudomonas sp. BN415 TaxID=2567889 RepID=UPI002454092C|nr:MlaD family protein [Pseudomonas sp. BN415]MDH4584490.1 MCE family protein [Pseudomonas sp. BN415]